MVPMSTRLIPRSPIPCPRRPLKSTRCARDRALGLGTAGAVLLGVIAILCGNGRSAQAQDKKSVVVLEIQGAPPKLQAGLEKALKGKYVLVPMAKWNSAASRLNATGQGTDEVALVAGDLKVDAVVTGKVKQDKDSGSYKLNIAARHGATGKPLGKLTYELKSAKVDSATIAQAEQDIEKAVEQAIAGPPPEAPPPVAAAAPETPTPSLRNEDENPIEKLKKLEAQDKRDREHVVRPVYYPYFDVGAAFIINGRSFSYAEETGTSPTKCYDFDHRSLDPNDPTNKNFVYRYTPALKSCPRYAPSVTGGVRVDLTGFPLAGVRYNGLRGLGIGITFDYMFWPPSMTAGANPRSLDTREFRLEGGLRYHWNVANKRSLPSILVSVQYGLHSFAVAKEQKTYSYVDDIGSTQTAAGIDDHGLPDILYQYVTIGLGGRIPYFTTEKLYFGLLINFNFHAMLSFGELGTTFADTSTVTSLYGSGGYGPATGYGFRAGFTPLELIPWKGITVRLSGFYEMFTTAFTLGSNANNNVSLPPVDRVPANAARHIAQGATDQYFGGIIQIGYQY